MKVKDLVKGNRYTDVSYPGEVFIYKYVYDKNGVFPGQHRFGNEDTKGTGIILTARQVETDTTPIEDGKYES